MACAFSIHHFRSQQVVTGERLQGGQNKIMQLQASKAAPKVPKSRDMEGCRFHLKIIVLIACLGFWSFVRPRNQPHPAPTQHTLNGLNLKGSW